MVNHPWEFILIYLPCFLYDPSNLHLLPQNYINRYHFSSNSNSNSSNLFSLHTLHELAFYSLNYPLCLFSSYISQPSQLNIPSLPTLMINYIQSGQNWICSNTLLSYPVLKGPRKIFWKSSGSLLYVYPVLSKNNIALFTPHGAIWTI